MTAPFDYVPLVQSIDRLLAHVHKHPDQAEHVRSVLANTPQFVEVWSFAVDQATSLAQFEPPLTAKARNDYHAEKRHQIRVAMLQNLHLNAGRTYATHRVQVLQLRATFADHLQRLQVVTLGHLAGIPAELLVSLQNVGPVGVKSAHEQLNALGLVTVDQWVANERAKVAQAVIDYRHQLAKRNLQ